MRLAVRLGVLLAASLIALALCEAALRIAGFSFHLYPQRIEFGWPDPQVLEQRYLADPDLFWVPSDYAGRLEAAARQRPDIVFLGDSCTEFGAYPRMLAALLRRQEPALEPTWLNLGVAGWSSYQGLRQLERDVVGLRPAVVTLYFGWNDHWVGFGIEDKRVRRVASSPLRALQPLRVVQLANRAWVAAAGGGRPEARPNRVSAADFRDNLSRMVRIAREHGIVPLLLTAPTAHERGEEPARLAGRWLRDARELMPLHREYVEVVRRVAAEESAPLCDLAARFDALPRAERRSLFGEDRIHLRPAGDRLVARTLRGCFLRHGLLERLRARGSD